MSEYGDEGGERPSEGGDNQPDEIPDETPDAPDETPDEELFNPNDETPDEELFNPNDETPDEELFNPNDETPDEELFNPNDETPDEEPFNPNDETPDEELFNPNDETPDEELFNPNDETPDEELFNPNDETPDEEPFNPNDDIPDEPPDENYNPSSSATITVTVPEEPKQGPDDNPETNPEQEHENEPEAEPESDPEEGPEKEVELINSEGDPMPPVESKEVMELRRDLEEAGLEPEYEPELDSEHEDQNPEIEPEYEPENEPESESKVESQQSPENEPESEPETQPEEIELMTPEGEPISHPEQVPTELIPLEDAIQKLYEQQQNPEGEPENEQGEIPEQESEIIPEQESETIPERDSEIIPEQESELIPEQESELIPEQKPDKIQKKKRIKAKNLKLITDHKELGEYKHYERQHIVKTKYDVIFGEKQFKKPKKKAKTKTKKPEKVKNLQLITDPKELENYTNYGERKTSKTQVEKSEGKPEQPNKPTQKKKSKRVKNLELITDPKEPEYTNYGERKTSKTQVEKSEGKPEKSSKQVQNTKPKEIKNLELITEPIKTEKGEEKNESKQEKSSESQNTSKKELDKVEIASSESQKQSQSSEHSNKQSKSETVSKNRLALREKYRQETGKRPIYNKKETKGFLSWLEKQKKLVLKKKQEKKVGESKEEWEILLEKWILEASESKVSIETKEELIGIIRKYRMFREIYLKLIELLERRNLTKKEDEDIKKMFQKLEQVNRIQADIFRNLRAFQSLYNQHNIWNMNRILREREKFVNFLTQKLKNLKKVEKTQQVVKKNWKEILKENLYKNTTLSLKEKSQIIKIIQKDKLNEENKKELISILKKLPIEDLISLIGNDFKQHTNKYVKWGWDYDIAVKKLMLNNFLKKMKSGETLKISNNKVMINYNLLLNPEKFIKIENNNIRKIYIKLKEMGFKSVKEIEEYLGASFKDPLYYGSVMKEADFFRLKELLGENEIKLLFNSTNIPHEIRVGYHKKIELNDDDDIAELITIMLGDGSLGLDGSEMSIALNNVDDEKYVKYVRELLSDIFQGIHIREKDVQDSKGYVLIINSKAVHHALVSKGLIPGNKIQNQVDVPNWIFYNINLIMRGLKGLFDTDGSIQVAKKNKSLVLSFSNASKPLVVSFKKMCNLLSIQTGKVNGPYIYEDKGFKPESKIYMVTIEAKEQVKKFLEKVKPEKLKEPYRYYWLGLNLLILGTPIYVKREIEQTIEKFKVQNDIKKFQYSKRNTIFLMKLCKEKLKNILPSKNFTFLKSLIDFEIKKALTLNPYGGIHLKNQEDIILRMPSGIRDFICSLVYNILSKYKGINREETLSILIKEILKLNKNKLINALKTSRFNIALKKYFKSLILLLEKIIANLNNSETISPTRLANDSMLNLPFGRKVIERIINHLKNDFPEGFNTYN